MSEINPPKFVCQGCAKCCSTLLTNNGTTGLTLLPEEISLFQSSLIKPQYGIGTFPFDKKFKILFYQLTDMVCPNLREKKCSIYQKRPLMCRRFPVQRLDYHNQNLKLSMDCTEWQYLASKFGDGTLIDISEDYTEAHSEIVKRTRFLSNLPDISIRAWFYNLKTHHWELYKDAIADYL
jgi:Fe-S-cluster containining protein